jgi:hypothetical protein
MLVSITAQKTTAQKEHWAWPTQPTGRSEQQNCITASTRRYFVNTADHLGPPDIEFGLLRFWIQGREFPRAKDYWDANWVNATVYCDAQGASVWVTGPILHLSELKQWAENSAKMYQTLSGHVDLKCIEPNLSVQMDITKTGQVDVQVDITADPLHQTHHFEFSIDQSYLPAVIQGCQAMLGKFPFDTENDPATPFSGRFSMKKVPMQ